jgi:hypothetical protein
VSKKTLTRTNPVRERTRFENEGCLLLFQGRIGIGDEDEDGSDHVELILGLQAGIFFSPPTTGRTFHPRWLAPFF